MREGLYQVASTIEIPFHDHDTFVTHEFRPAVLGHLKQGDMFKVLSSSKEDGFIRALILVGSGATSFMAAIKVGENLPSVVFQRKLANQAVVAHA